MLLFIIKYVHTSSIHPRSVRLCLFRQVCWIFDTIKVVHRGANLSWIFFRERSSMKLLYMTNQIFCKLHSKLNFGIFCYSLRWLENVVNFSSESFFVAIFLFTAHQKNKNKLLPWAQLFDFYVIKFRSNVTYKYARFCWSRILNLYF